MGKMYANEKLDSIVIIDLVDPIVINEWILFTWLAC
jgi:hypothetical protein